MRYLIITYDDYYNIPYIRFYEDHLKRIRAEYDIVLWNRSGRKTEMPNAFVFSAKNYRSRMLKILPFLRWRRFALRVLKEGNYDRLIVLTTMPGVLLADRLTGEYRKKFWFDIRDFTYENVPFYKKQVEKLAFAAEAVSISSPAFQSFLPDSGNIVLTHNISNQDAAEAHCTMDMQKRPLCIGYVGGVQFTEQNQLLLRRFANNPDYCLKYVGETRPGCDLQPFCAENGIKNVEFHPAFTNDQKPGIYRGIQLINCVYGCDTPVSRLLLPNRLYDCVLFKKPILVSRGTYLEQVVTEYGLGLAVDARKDDVVKALDDYLSAFDRQKFEAGCALFLAHITKEIAQYERALSGFFGESQAAPLHSVSEES